MKKDQEFTPKYWIVHDTTTDDVFLHTASKSMDRSIQKHDDLYGGYDCFEEGSNLRCSLFELRIVIE